VSPYARVDAGATRLDCIAACRRGPRSSTDHRRHSRLAMASFSVENTSRAVFIRDVVDVVAHVCKLL